MKTIFIYQAVHRVHRAWLLSITKKFYPCISKHASKKMFYQTIYKYAFINFNLTILHQILSIFQSIKIPKADIYVIEGIKAALPAILNKKKNTKIIMINSDTFFYNYSTASFLMRKIYDYYLKKIDGVISTSYMMKKMAEKHIKKPNVVVYPFVDLKFNNIRADISQKKIIFTGRIIKDKGIPLLIKSVNSLDSKYIDKLYLIGNIDEEIPELKKENKRIILTGWTDQVENYLKQGSIYINLANHESFGVGILEAMTAGIIPIVTEKCGIKELIKPISKRLIVDRNVSEIKKTIEWIQSNKDNKLKLSKQCKQMAMKFNKKNSINQFKMKFNELCNVMNK